MAEQLALRELAGERAAVDGDERAGASGRPMQLASDELLAGSGRTEHEDGDGRGGDLLDLPTDALHGERGTQQRPALGHQALVGPDSEGLQQEDGLADTHHAAVPDRRALRALALHEGAVPAALVHDAPPIAVPLDARVGAGDGAVGEGKPAGGSAAPAPDGEAVALEDHGPPPQGGVRGRCDEQPRDGQVTRKLRVERPGLTEVERVFEGRHGAMILRGGRVPSAAGQATAKSDR